MDFSVLESGAPLIRVCPGADLLHEANALRGHGDLLVLLSSRVTFDGFVLFRISLVATKVFRCHGILR